MNCARCGTEITEGISTCPKCGLKLKRTPGMPAGLGSRIGPPKSSRPDVFPPPRVQPGQGPAQVPPSPSNGKRSSGPRHPPPRPPVPTTGGTPGDVHTQPQAQYPPGTAGQPVPMQYQGAPGDVYAQLPPGAPGAHPPAPGMAPYPLASTERGSRLPALLIVVIIASLLVTGAGATAYFLFLRKTGGYTGPAATVEQYLIAEASGDVNTVKSLFTAVNTPTDAQLNAIASAASLADYEYIDIKLKTLEESATRAKVEILDYTFSASAGSQEIKFKLSDLKPSEMKVSLDLAKVDGKWLIDEKIKSNPTNLQVQPNPSGST